MQFSCEAKAMKHRYSQEIKMHAMDARWIRDIPYASFCLPMGCVPSRDTVENIIVSKNDISGRLASPIVGR